MLTKPEALREPHQGAGAALLSAGRAHACAHGQVPTAGGAARTAGHRPGAGHAEIPADNPTAGAADTCRRTGLSPPARSSQGPVPTGEHPLLLLRSPSLHFYSCLPPRHPHASSLLPLLALRPQESLINSFPRSSL